MFRSASELAELVRSGECSATELVHSSLERIDALDGAVGAFVEVDVDGALAAAAAIGPGDAPSRASRSRSRTTARCAVCD
jgi:Asp-tRNA(Asn)/Glu-tRNA(Gln) amidotransferase A subunit family amidase